MNYLIKFDENGRRGETYVAEEKTQEEVQTMLDDGFELVSEEDYQLLIGNIDGKEYIRTYDLEGNPIYEEYIPPQPSDEELNKQQAEIQKSELREFAITAMMSSLASNDMATMQAEYKSKLDSIKDGVALYIPEVFPVWSSNSVEYKKDDRVSYNGVLYKVLTGHTSQESWKPDVSPSLFVKVISSISGEIPEWEQPSADNAYMKGDRVRLDGKIYESLIDNNVWKPTDYPAGWKDITEEVEE